MASVSVEIQLTNRTGDITLRNPRSYCYSGNCSVPPNPIILPGHTGCCTFKNSPGQGSAGVLVYEAETFTLAILFSNNYNYGFYNTEFAVEISPEKAHRGSLEMIYDRMYRRLSANSSNNGMFQFVRPSATQQTIIVSAGGTEVMATMSKDEKSIIKVVVVNQ
ncbi:uncharacterized protein LOC107325889 isoform X1 [Coturnix japonica]|uniref:uncharacterized protein LOC107325889 isoform X1 n=1 Tax=Coturnix japonica TaxID=93934 RepID=UPI000777F927|nr:uncharacterized protein LOC107325889 isoform X1 [Coturnix japonica]XP_032297020.1 uncharacterized protein LOC107325889 isoform X1 [Coturnix japonica]